MMPSQKLGMDWPNMASVMMPPSMAVPRFSAAMMPSGTASPMARMMATSVSSTVAGKCCMITPSVGVL